MKYGYLNSGQIEAMVNKLGGEENFRQVLRGNLEIDYQKLAQYASPEGKVTWGNFIKCCFSKWEERDGVIYFSVTSNGKTGEEWIKYFEEKAYRISDYAKSMLRSKDFKPTSGVTTEVAVLKGMLFPDSDRVTKKIRTEAASRKFLTPDAELACLIRDKFTDEELEAMGLYWIVVMHEPINDSDGVPGLLGSGRDVGGRWLRAYYDRPVSRWSSYSGFAFAISQVVLDSPPAN